MMSRQIALFGLIGLAACAADTRTDRTDRPVEQARVPANLQIDHDFIMKAASGGTFEVESSRLALARQVPDEVTEVAQTLIRDHQQANEKLMNLADEKAVKVPQQMNPEHTRKLDTLRGMQGNQFVTMYNQIQKNAHQETIALFERCSKYCQDLDVRAFASQTLPTLRKHLQHIQGAQASLRRQGTQQEQIAQPQPQQQDESEEPHDHDHE
jgi:putative membrane protein